VTLQAKGELQEGAPRDDEWAREQVRLAEDHRTKAPVPMPRQERNDRYAGRTRIASGQYGGGHTVKVDKNLKDWSKMIGHARSMNRQHDEGKRQTEEDVTCKNGHPMVFQTRDLATWAHECSMCTNQLGTAFACCTVGCNESFTCEDCFFNAGGNTSRNAHVPDAWDDPQWTSHWPGLPGYSSGGASSSSGWNTSSDWNYNRVPG